MRRFGEKIIAATGYSNNFERNLEIATALSTS